MRLLLDEMWSARIAVQLRRRGFDVVAVTEPEYADRYRNTEDELVFARAQEDGRAVVTDNVVDFESIRIGYEARAEAHHGLIYATAPHFDRNQPAAVIGQMVQALDQLLRSLPAEHEPFNRAHWLRPAA